MKKTNSDANYALRQTLKESVLFTDPRKPNGILSTDRLDNSVLEDVIVNGLPLNFKQIQEGVLNVNIFVPNKVLEFEKTVDRSQRDSERIAELESLMVELFDDGIWGYDYNFALQQSVVYEDTKDTHYINFRVEYVAVNI